MARQWTWHNRSARRRRIQRMVELVAPAPGAVGVYLGAPDSTEARALAAALSPATLLLVPDDGVRRHLLLAARGPVDFIVDSHRAEGRLDRFSQTLYHLRPGSRYVVPGGASELGPNPGPLGELLREAARMPADPLRVKGLRPNVSRLLALRHHVRAEAVGDDLVLSHDLDDVLVKIREEDLNGFIEAERSRHRVLGATPPATPSLPVFRNLPADGTDEPAEPIEDVELFLRDYRDVVVGPWQMVLDGRLILPDSYRHPRSDPLRSNAFADLNRLFSVPRVPLPDEIPHLAGTFVHLDNEMRGHFGHLLTETMSRTWSWSQALAIDPDVRALVCARPARRELADYELEIYEACGIPRDRVVLVDGPTRVDRLLSGTPMFSNPHFVHGRIAETWDAVGDRLLASAGDREWPRRLFIGRRETKRACANPEEVEAQFTRRGFEVVFPEDHSLGDQVQMFRRAEVIAGYAGSGMFQIAFVPEPRRVIQVTSDGYTPRNELLIAAVRGHRIDRISCRSEPSPPQWKSGLRVGFRYDPAREGPALEQVLAEVDVLGADGADVRG